MVNSKSSVCAWRNVTRLILVKSKVDWGSQFFRMRSNKMFGCWPSSLLHSHKHKCSKQRCTQGKKRPRNFDIHKDFLLTAVGAFYISQMNPAAKVLRIKL